MSPVLDVLSQSIVYHLSVYNMPASNSALFQLNRLGAESHYSDIGGGGIYKEPALTLSISSLYIPIAQQARAQLAERNRQKPA